MKRVRMLLRVSSEQQLEEDGDLSVQRQILVEFIEKQKEWLLDKKEYFEGSKSAYKNTSSQREVLQKILKDAQSGEFDILVPYKDDRVGRLMWDTPQYIMRLKELGVDVYTVKDGCISPESDDILGQMMLAFRYANAQKSSADTGMRVKDTAQKLVEQGKFMGGCAPYGYRLEYSGKISKHGRALKKLVIVPEEAQVVTAIYDLSLNRAYGSVKIAKELNLSEKYRKLAPGGVWKSGTITSILTNPIYAGYTAYKRREKKNGKYHRLDSKNWVISHEANEEIRIIEENVWNCTQEKRKMRGSRYIKNTENDDRVVIRRNDGILPLIDVIYCGYCGCKLSNGSRYNYWTIKETGEKRASKVFVYRCPGEARGVPHEEKAQFRAERIEPAIFELLAEFAEKLLKDEDVYSEIGKNRELEKETLEREIKKKKQELDDTQGKIEVLEERIPQAMSGSYPLSLEELTALIRKQKEKREEQHEEIMEKEAELKNITDSVHDREERKQETPTWKEIFLHGDSAVKRVLVNQLIERIDVTREEVAIRFKINMELLVQNGISYTEKSISKSSDSEPRKNGDSGVPE